jgi:hypothetical protein
MRGCDAGSSRTGFPSGTKDSSTMSQVEQFQEEFPSIDSYWRSIVLFGKNTSSYKFSLAESLLDEAKSGKSSVTLEEIAFPYAENVCRHIEDHPRQSTGKQGSFLKACQEFNDGEISQDELIDSTVESGFNYVLDAFHIVNGKEVPVRFFEVEGSGKSRKVHIPDITYELIEGDFGDDIESEAEARWDLVEYAWDVGISSNLLTEKSEDGKDIILVDNSLRRKNVESAKDALNGYQKGRCFYCYEYISLDLNDEEHRCDVDHFYPHTLQPLIPEVNFDGVWNLVLACKECNRGRGGKFAYAPAVKYLERLSKRNEFLIGSHHPLRETLIRQTGATPEARRLFLRYVDRQAIGYLIHRWETPPRAAPTF